MTGSLQSTGRFLNTDPVIANIFDGQTFHAFSYLGNNPFTNPSRFDLDS